MQRKGNKPKIYSNISNKLHSIPKLKKNVKSNVVYSIPSVCMLTLCLGLLSLSGIMTDIVCADAGYADWPAVDKATITPVSGGTSTPPTVSLSLSKPNMVSDTTTPGSIATVDTNVIVDVKNADSYTLTLKVNDTTMTSGNTTISAGNVVNDNTWGYKWDGAASYTTPSTSGTALLVPTVDSNGNSSFTKNLTFGVKFASDADAGHYKASGTLSLVANPRAAAKITLADLTEMQQLAEGYAPEACENTPYIEDKVYNLTDVRDGNTYTVSKFKDGKCWMTQNLKLNNIVGDTTYAGRTLNPTTSDIAANYTLPASNVSKFNTTNTTEAFYLGADARSVTTGYYTWCAATAGTCSSATSNGANTSYSICPKGWKLPTGGRNSTTTDFWLLVRNMGLTISTDSLDQTGNGTAWGTGDLTKIQSSPYNFNYTGYVNGDSYYAPASRQFGYWWSSTAGSSTAAYSMDVNSSNVYPGTANYSRYLGCAVRCVSQ